MLEAHLKKLIPFFEGRKIMVIGDLMLDEHIWSSVSRISPEAPVVVADVSKITHVPGGCGNVAANIVALSGIPCLIGLIGRDSSGDKLQRALRNYGISTDKIIITGERPTILKSRVIAGSQHVVRVDREERSILPEKLADKVLAAAKKMINKIDAIIISDYGKGIVSHKSCREIIAFARHEGKPVLVDPKGDDYTKYKGATVLTPNLSETELAVGFKIKNEETLIKAAKDIISQTHCDHLIVTRGREGMSVFSKNEKVLHIPAVPREVFDITGAGDTVIATLSLALASKATITEAAMLGNFAASVKVTKIATQPVYREELEEALEEREPSTRKIKSRKDLGFIVNRLKSEHAKIIFTNGCFDILHLGHVRYLKEAKKLGDILIVGVNSDSSVRKLKGNDRPYISELERAEILASLECVDYVSIFPETRPDNLIKIVKPDIHVKGGDYSLAELPERHLVERLGGRVVVIPPIKGRSTTNIIEKILGKKK